MKTADRNGPSRPPKLTRLATKGAKSEPGKIDRKNGVLRGYSVITRGEALGHGLWIDSEMLSQVADAGNSSPNGIKSRFTHPGLSSDGLGKAVGRATNFRVEGDRVLADLNLLESASKSPEGDLRDWVLSMADEAPDMFATSIVFARDVEAEDAFAKENSVQQKGQSLFISPDQENKANLPHARLASLRASDLVDEPAANPGGFFSEGEELAESGERILSYLFGLSDEVPEDLIGNIDPQRAKEFVQGFLQRNRMTKFEEGESVSLANNNSATGAETNEGEGIMGDQPITLESLKRDYPELLESIRDGAFSEGSAEGFAKGRKEGVDCAVNLLEAMSGFKGFGEFEKTWVDLACKELREGKTQAEAVVDFKIAYNEHLEEKASNVIANSDPEKHDRYANGMSVRDRVNKLADELCAKGVKPYDAFIQASKEIEEGGSE